MMFVSEEVAAGQLTMEEAITAVAGAFAALDAGDAAVFPVALGRGSEDGTRFAMKSGLLASRRLCGMKLGTYWPGNPLRGLESHGSTTLLLDDATGFPVAVVQATHLTAMRTAAADGVAVRTLARADAKRLAVIGAGHQAWFEILAVHAVRPLEHVAIWARRADAAERLAARVRDELGICAGAIDARAAVERADIVVTVTASREPLVEADWVRPGTHVSAMGADSPDKQELSVELLGRSSLFADVPEQSVTIGEFRAAAASGMIGPADIVPIGAVMAGRAKGRTSDAQITVFDSSGMALQDIAVASIVVDALKARQTGASGSPGPEYI